MYAIGPSQWAIREIDDSHANIRLIGYRKIRVMIPIEPVAVDGNVNGLGITWPIFPIDLSKTSLVNF